eukprot:8702647-Alexandrium_andersonii.AAC.1
MVFVSGQRAVRGLGPRSWRTPPIRVGTKGQAARDTTESSFLQFPAMGGCCPPQLPSPGRSPPGTPHQRLRRAGSFGG